MKGKIIVSLLLTAAAFSGMAGDAVNIYNPFHIGFDPMERLLLVNFEKDADSLYIGFEPQVFEDDVNGRGHLVIGWRSDGRVDVYHEPGLKLNPEKYNIAGKGLANMAEREMRKAFFEINDNGVQAHYCFRDVHNREVEIKIAESNPKKRKPFGLLAPMGDAVENPSAMPLVLLHDFYFVRRKHTDIEITINGRQHQIDYLPIPLDGSRMTFVRYSPEPLIATFNPAYEGELAYLSSTKGTAQIQSGNNDFHLLWKDGLPFIKSIVFNNATHPVEIRFIDPFPDIASLADQSLMKGRFEIEAHPSTGRIRGHYMIEKAGGQTTIVLNPSGGWKPRPDKLSLRFLYTVASVFKKWPATYEWRAVIQQHTEGAYAMRSGWERI